MEGLPASQLGSHLEVSRLLALNSSENLSIQFPLTPVGPLDPPAGGLVGAGEAVGAGRVVGDAGAVGAGEGVKFVWVVNETRGKNILFLGGAFVSGFRLRGKLLA